MSILKEMFASLLNSFVFTVMNKTNLIKICPNLSELILLIYESKATSSVKNYKSEGRRK